MLAFANNNKTLSILISFFVLFVVIIFNTYYLIADDPFSFMNSNTGVMNEGLAPGQEAGAELLQNPDETRNLLEDFIPLLAMLGMLVVFILGLLFVFKSIERKNIKQSKIFIDQLHKIATAFVTYQKQVGTYPLSKTYDIGHYTAVHLGREWMNYGFPTDSEMKQFLADWPVVPAKQLSSILYYPRKNGQGFDLYAKVGFLPKELQHNYNHEDDLPKAWGEFDYKISSNQLQESGPPHASQASSTAHTGPLDSPVNNQISIQQNDTTFSKSEVSNEQLGITTKFDDDRSPVPLIIDSQQPNE